LEIGFFNKPTGIFHTPHLSQFINSVPRFQTLIEARVIAFGPEIWSQFPHQHQHLATKYSGWKS
jgi:hypothetical protein